MTDENTFFNKLGKRIAELRQARGLSQQQLAQSVGLSQQIVACYEIGYRHAPLWRLMKISETLGVQVEDLINDSKHSKQKNKKPGPIPKIQKLMDQLCQLPKSRQRFILKIIEDAIARSN